MPPTGGPARGVRALLVALCLVPPSGPQASAEHVRSVFEEQVERFGSAPSADAEEVARGLAGLPGALESYFALVGSRSIPGPDGAAVPLGDDQQRLLAATAPRFERSAVIGFVRDGLSADRPEPWRRVALDLLGRHALAGDLSLLTQLTVDAQNNPVPALVEPFTRALTEVLRRVGSDPRELSWLAGEREVLAPAIARAVGAAGDPRGLPWLTGWLDDSEAGAVALQEVVRLAPRARGELAAEVATSILPFLHSEDAGRRRHAIRVLGVLGTPSAFLPLVEVLGEEGTSGERKMARAALRQIAGVDLAESAEAWRGWHAREQLWLEQELEPTLEGLASEDDARVVAAIQELSGHSLHRDRIAPRLVPLLSDHASPAVRAQVCLGLARLGSSPSARQLVGALEDEDLGVRRRALQALRSITGLSLAADPDAWSEALEARG